MKRTAAVAAATFISLAMATTPAWASDTAGGPHRPGCDVEQTGSPRPPIDTTDLPPLPAIDTPVLPPPPPPVTTVAPPTTTYPTTEIPASPPVDDATRETQPSTADEKPVETAEPETDEDSNQGSDANSPDELDESEAAVAPVAFVSHVGRPEWCGHDGRDHDGHDPDGHDHDWRHNGAWWRDHDGRDDDHDGRDDDGDDSVSYENCDEARDAGAAPVFWWEDGYASHLDSDDDGIGCEWGGNGSDDDDNGDSDDGDDDGDDSSSDSGGGSSGSSDNTVSVSDYGYSSSISLPVGGVATGVGPAK